MSKPNHIPFLDGIRGLAILAVFLFHGLGAAFGYDHLEWDGWFRRFDAPLSFYLLYPVTYGHAGVAVFFVVSGFCIHMSHQRSITAGWLTFANRRFFRIYPPFLLSVLLFLLVWPWGDFALRESDWWQLLSHLLVIHNVSKETFFGINPSFWSIAIEAQLYLIYPLLLILCLRLGWERSLMIAGCFEVVLRIWGGNLPFWIFRSPFAYWLSWSIGAYLCDGYLKGSYGRVFRCRFDLCFLVAIALPFFRPTAPLTFLAFSFVTAIAVHRLLTGAWMLPEHTAFRKVWSHLSFLGLVSYSFYLLHQPIMGITGGAVRSYFPAIQDQKLGYYCLNLAWYPATLVAAYAFYRLVEQPSILVGKYIAGKCKPSDSGLNKSEV